MIRGVAAAASRAAQVLALLLLALPAPVPAQATASIEAGLTRVRYGGSSPASVFAVSPFVQFERPDSWFGAGSTLSAFEAGDWGLQGSLSGSHYLPPLIGLQPELSGLLQADRAADGTRAGEAAARLRFHLLSSSEGLWTGGAAGWADGLTGTRGVRSIELGGWVRREQLTLVASLAPEWVGDSTRVVDAEALARFVTGPVELALFGGVRQFREPDDAAERWGGASVAWWFGPHLAATLSTGSYPGDPAREFAAGRYTTFGIRFATERPDYPERSEQPAYRLLPPLARPVVAEMTVERAGDRQNLRVRAPGARRVELMGDFTDWQPIALRRAGHGWWEGAFPLAPGVYRLNVRVDGAEWGVPPGIPTVRDDFSGVVALLTIR